MNTIIDLRSDLIEYVNTNYYGSKLEDYEDIVDLVDELSEIIVNRLESKIRYYDKCMKEPQALMEECSYDCLTAKKKALSEVIAMLRKKSEKIT